MIWVIAGGILLLCTMSFFLGFQVGKNVELTKQTKDILERHGGKGQ